MRLRHKFNAVRCEADGIKFPSKKERMRYLTLKRFKREFRIRIHYIP
jgi:hypothetical protein